MQSLAQGVACWVHSCLSLERRVGRGVFTLYNAPTTYTKKEIHVEIDGDGCGFSVTDIGGVFVDSLECVRQVGRDWRTGTSGDRNGKNTDIVMHRLNALEVLVRHGLVKVESMQPGRFEAFVAVFKKGGELVEVGRNNGLERRRSGTRVVVKDWDRGHFSEGVDTVVKAVRAVRAARWCLMRHPPSSLGGVGRGG